MTTPTISTEVNTVVDAYLASLGETDPGRRAALIEKAWTPNGRYVDPARDITGKAAMEETIAGVQQHTPGVSFRRTSAVDVHHEYLRFSWDMVAPDGSVALVGIDVGTLADDGRLSSICGFFGELPAA
jgi:hypothetical protein